MIAFGCASTDERRFRAGAARAIEEAAEPDSPLLRRHVYDSIADSYGEMLAAAAGYEDLEALVLFDQSVSRADPQLPARLRALLAASPDVAVIGAGATPGVHEVEAVGGALLALSAWAVRELRCDASVSGALDALAMDLCFQARARGRRVLASGALGVAPVSRVELEPPERRAWLRSAVAVRRKWRADHIPSFGSVSPGS
jgi:hypothetical protein